MAIPGYKILRKIDSGGMSTVYLAIQLSVGREVALKVLAPELRDDPTFGDRFFREANILGSLSHPHIVQVYDVGQHEQFYYIAMDYISGPSFKEKIHSGMTFPEALKITRQILTALAYAHERGYVHQDVKPDNVLFKTDGNAILTDFGIAEAMKTADENAAAGSVIGTPHYMSPEQAQGKATDARSDLYSLGVLFYEMIMGEVPFKGEEAVEVAVKHLTAPIPKLPPQYKIFQSFLNKLMAKKPDQRYQSAKESIDALTAIEQNFGGDERLNLTTSQTEPTAMQAYSLLGALLSSLGAVIMLLVKRGLLRLSLIKYLGYLPHKGFYLRAPKKLKQSTNDELNNTTSENQTLFTNEIAAFLDSTEPKPLLGAIKSLGLILLLVAIIGGPIWLSSNSNKTAPIAKNPVPAKPVTPKPALPIEAPKPVEKPKPEKKEVVEVQQEPELVAPVIVEQPKFNVTINTVPNDAEVRILNIVPKYQAGIELEAGRYDVEVSADGYKPARQWFEVNQEQFEFSVELEKIATRKAGDQFADKMPDGTSGPTLVILPKGQFTMGDLSTEEFKGDGDELPARNISIDYMFAMSQHEITKAQYIRFAVATNTALPRLMEKIQDDQPAIGIGYKDALAYTEWLSKITNQTYRLPSETEWEYAARAGTSSLYWWGNEKPKDKANCRSGCESQWNSTFKLSGAPVGSFEANPFKLYDMNGNASEWVLDCYIDNYANAPTDGSAVQKDKCSQRVLRGGSFRDNYKQLTSSARQPVRSRGNKASGFRIVREL